METQGNLVNLPGSISWKEHVEAIDQAEIEKMAFSPWNTQDFKPIGTINMARKLIYDQSAEKRGGCPLHRD